MMVDRGALWPSNPTPQQEYSMFTFLMAYLVRALSPGMKKPCWSLVDTTLRDIRKEPSLSTLRQRQSPQDQICRNGDPLMDVKNSCSRATPTS